MLLASHYNYWIVIALMMIGLYMVIAQGNLVKKIIGLNIFQTSVFIFYISVGKVNGAAAPILSEGDSLYSNPLPHVLILTAIVVGIATTALALALTIRIKRAYGSIEERDIQVAEDLHERALTPPRSGQHDGRQERKEQ
ncbi:cation:proton antiporter subunit C [Microbulbifer sp.]|uniref:cation:proton antiporter subunit C n=1 Tax=Microbulbifer sp. TaxID=1908541 RepID=UPI002589B073|nr:cation:proton antiporter subunit C [Microbulbifer sp.]